MIHEQWEATLREVKEVKFPHHDHLKAKRWNEFQEQLPATMSQATNLSHMKKLIKDAEAEHHEAVKLEVQEYRLKRMAACEECSQGFRAALAKKYLVNPKTVREHLLWKLSWSQQKGNSLAEVEEHYITYSALIN